MIIEKVISGGQTGADRSGLEAALRLGIPIGGWCPRGRRAEDGRVPDRYPLRETAEDTYPPRTKANIRDSDATLILSPGGTPGPGSIFTAEECDRQKRPCRTFVVPGGLDPPSSPIEIARWLVEIGPRILNVAGSRGSSAPWLERAGTELLVDGIAIARLRWPIIDVGWDESVDWLGPRARGER